MSYAVQATSYLITGLLAAYSGVRAVRVWTAARGRR
jgi:hypothetical protein